MMGPGIYHPAFTAPEMFSAVRIELTKAFPGSLPGYIGEILCCLKIKALLAE